MSDAIRPGYYQTGDTDLIGLMVKGLLPEDETIGFLKGNVLKYVTRFQHKNGTEDLRKADEYLRRLIGYEAHLEASENGRD